MMKRIFFSSVLTLVFVISALAQNPSTARRIRYGTPPSTCNPSTGDVYIDTSVTPPDFVRCVATNKWERESTGKVNAQTGTTYTFVKADRNKLTTFSNGSAIAAVLPQATSSGDFLSGWNTAVYNLGAGTVTITPTTSTINGGSSITVAQGEGAWIFSNGTNYSALKTISTTTGAGTVTTTGSPANGNLAKFSGPTAITNTDLTGDVTTSGGVATTITNSAVTNAKIANSTIDLTTKVTGALPAANITSSVLDDSVAYCADAGSNDTYACSLSPAPAGYVTGARYRFKANTANTGAATINFNSLGAKTIKKLHDQDLADNDVEVGSVVDLVYDGTNMQMQSQIANSAGGGGTTINSTDDYVPVRSNSTTFVDSRLKKTSTNVMSFSCGLDTPCATRVYQTDNGGNFAYGSLEFSAGSGGFLDLKTTGGGDHGAMDIGISPSGNRYKFSTTSFLPPTNQGQDFGASGTRWAVAYVTQLEVKSDDVVRWSSSTKLSAPTDGMIQIKANSGATAKLAFNDSGSSAPMLKGGATSALEAKLADDSGYTTFVALKHCYSGTTVCDWAGSGSPEGVITAGVGSTYRRTDGGASTSFYVKESGSGNTGWVAK
jgi:hypothetical protein